MIILVYLPPFLILVYFLWKRSKYKNRKNAGAFFYENDCLVLNTGIPYPIPIDNIDYVKFKYNPFEVEYKLSYSLFIQVFQKNGKKKTVYYKGFKTAKLRTPDDMIKSLEEKKIHYEIEEI